MRILILGSPQSEETKLLLSSAITLGHEAKVILIRQLIFKSGAEKIVTYQGNDIAGLFDVAIIRGMNQHPDETLLLCSYLAERGVAVVDKKLTDKRYFRTKLATAFKFAKSAVNYPQTYFVIDPENVKRILSEAGFPIIVKEVWGMHSQGVLRFTQKEEAEDFFKDKKSEYLIQEDLKEDEYLRIFVIGNEIVGAMKRTKKRSLSSEAVKSGVKSEKIEIDEELKKLALEVMKISGNDICGIDLIRHQGKYYLIEANRSPQFRAFSKVVGINVAEKIIKYLELQTSKK
jgi:RimK family alpha-L-glutamate ligase